MTDFIDREAVTEYLMGRIKDYLEMDDRLATIPLKFAMAYIQHLPTADVEPVRHGRWEQSIFAEDFKRCSVCSSIWSRTSNYCPHCGAKMDGGGEDG